MKLEEKRSEEMRRRDGVHIVDDLLSYTEFYQLVDMIAKNWEKFSPIFDDKARTIAYLGSVEDVRNNIAHSRQLVQYERDLLSGIAGQIRNQVALYRSNEEESRNYYPLIESLRDGFGNEGRGTGFAGPPASRLARLDVGHVLEFTGSAFSATNSPVKWYLSGTNLAQVEVTEGNDVTFSFTVTEECVGESFSIFIIIVADSKYHRYPMAMGSMNCDDYREFYYSVNPPL